MANSYKIGASDTRPWGQWRVLDTGTNFVVKRIMVNKGGILSLQRHSHRSEHWIVTSGTATVTLGEQILTITKDEHVYIPALEWHRVENRSTEQLVFIEIQTGTVLDEGDIERREDKYGRC